jgi:NADPH-dependent 2,4-dienoyl-CoA reductase/sulfur reductase-like enzyme
MAAAVTSAESGASVVLLDDNPHLGGQVWRGAPVANPSGLPARWLRQLQSSSVKVVSRARVFYGKDGLLFAETEESVYQVKAGNLILATGARERFLPFRGWTLPNVLGAGALQALIKSGLSVKEKKIVIAGTGPLLFAAAECAREHKAKVACIAEQCGWKQFLSFGSRMMQKTNKRAEALRLQWRLRGIPHWKNCWPIEALGKERLEAVRLRRNDRTEEIPCDYLACGFHLIPNVELAEILGCTLVDGFVAVDERQQTSIRGVFCAGEPTGIGGLDVALLQGQIAGCAATKQTARLRDLCSAQENSKRMVAALRQGTRLRPELEKISDDDTVVCRCEDVTLGELRKQNSGTEAKLQTRCGMGPCQGRICGPAVKFLFGWTLNRLRPPLFPIRCESLAAIGSRTVTNAELLEE